MKKVLIYIIFLIIICFILPAIFTSRKSKALDKNESINTSAEDVDSSRQNDNFGKYNYNKYGEINLLHSKTGEVETVKLDDYLCNVVSAEMPASFDEKALQAQAIVARTYTIYKVIHKKHDNADICDDSTCCQAWISKEDRFAKWEESQRESNWNKIESAVKSTVGKIITYNNEPINAFFHSNSGGTTELPVNVWGGSGYPYLQSVQTAGEEGYTQYASEVSLNQSELIEKLKSKYEDISIDFTNDDDLKILEYTESGRVKTVKFGNHEVSGTEARTILGLKSTNFEIKKEGENIKFEVKGYGHGVGMSQTGADSMAKQGATAEEIIKHFYTDVEIKEVNSI